MYDAMLTCQGEEVLSQEARGREESSAQRGNLAGFSIVLAEDDFICRYMIVSYLEQEGGRVLACENGLEVLHLLQKEQADIILMDIKMPLLDGLETTKRIREAEGAEGRHHLPIIALTAHGTAGYDKICLAAGMDGYFRKPLDLERLTETIFGLCKKREASRQHRPDKPRIQ